MNLIGGGRDNSLEPKTFKQNKPFALAASLIFISSFALNKTGLRLSSCAQGMCFTEL